MAQLYAKLGRRTPMEEPDDASECQLLLVGVKGQTFRRIACLRRDIRNSVKTRAAPETANWPKCMRCQSPATPAFAEN